jgi:pyruvate dehydrogenase E2 component (dihydrolipoamide acetyltransferase)
MTGKLAVRPLSPIRRMIAARTAEAKRVIPHFRLRVDIETDSLDRVRRDSFQSGSARPSLTDFLIKACADTLIEVPALNIQWADEGIRQLQRADIAVVVALEDGVSTPVVREADLKSVRQISLELADLRERARRNALKTEEIFGGSFSISNLGMYGIVEFDAIINPPQCAILAAGAARSCVIPGAGSGTALASIMRVTLSCDHRAIDGAVGARFLSVLKRRIEALEQVNEWATA